MTHPGHHDREHPGAVDVGRRAEQHVGGRPAGVLRRRVVDVDDDRLAAARQGHVVPARRDVDLPCDDLVPVRGFDNLERASAIEPLGQHPGEHRRHVLDDEDRDWRSAGSPETTAGRESGPPVDAAMTIAVTARRARRGLRWLDGRRRPLEGERPRISGSSSPRTLSSASPMPSALGFSATPVAPAASASNVADDACAVRWL